MFLVLREHARTYTRARVLSFLEVSRASNISDPSPSILTHRTVTLHYTRLKKPQYLVAGFPLYSLSSPYFVTASSDAQNPKIILGFARSKKPQQPVNAFTSLHHFIDADHNLYLPVTTFTQPIVP